jgi:predicted ABC-type sugar transport system permease subunit
MKLPPFIVTLGTWHIFNGHQVLYSANETIRTQDIEAQAPLLQFFGIQFQARAAPCSRYGVIFMVLLVIFLWYVLNYTAWGGASMRWATIRMRPISPASGTEEDAAHHLYVVGPDLRHRRLGR